MQKRNLLLSSIIISTFFSVSAQKTPMLASAIVTKSEVKDSQKEHVVWTERVEERTLKTSTFYSNDGQIKIVNSSVPINFYNDGKLIPIDPELIQTSTNEWEAIQQPYPTKLRADGSFSVSLDGNQSMMIGSEVKINGTKAKGEVELSNNNAFIEEFVNGVHKELMFRENGVKSNYLLDNPIAINGNELTISESVTLPKGYSLVKDESYGEERKLGWSGRLLILNTNGKSVGTINLPVCYDANNQIEIASYTYKKTEDGYILNIHADKAWLNDASRAYPVVIDPLVTGPTTTWAGGTMPSCFAPTYNQDSILVSIPAEITITELNVTASFYADPFTSAVMADGTMFFSTDCDQSQNFSITGAPGQQAGTAYLDDFNMYNPITCCFPESCSSQSFYLSYHLARTLWGAGCNTTYIRYDPVTTSWPFRAEVVGRTVETYAAEWNIIEDNICSTECDLTGLTYARYGVTPYTFTHPWSQDVIVNGSNNGCSAGNTIAQLQLTNPNCPVYCDANMTTLAVPPPIIVDACGNTVTGILGEFLTIKPAPGVIANYDSIICSGDPYTISLQPCIPGATMNWTGNGDTGTSSIVDTVYNTSGSMTTINYTVLTELNGCAGDTAILPIYVNTSPLVQYSSEPDPIIAGVEAAFFDQTNFYSATGVFWSWDFGDGGSALSQDATHLYPNAGSYPFCLYVADDNGCEGELCKMINVYPAEVTAPNIISSNGDGINDYLEFGFLDFYPTNQLTIMNRWGNVVYQTSNYQNNWSGEDHTEGTYFFLLTIPDADQEIQGFFELVK